MPGYNLYGSSMNRTRARLLVCGLKTHTCGLPQDVADKSRASQAKFSFRHRGHRTGVHTGANSTPLEGPWTPLQQLHSSTGKEPIISAHGSSTILVASESFPKVSFSGYCTMAEALSHASRAERVASRAHGSSEAVGEHSIPAVVPPATPSHRLTRGESALRVRRNGMRGTRAGPTQTTEGQTLAGGA